MNTVYEIQFIFSSYLMQFFLFLVLQRSTYKAVFDCVDIITFVFLLICHSCCRTSSSTLAGEACEGAPSPAGKLFFTISNQVDGVVFQLVNTVSYTFYFVQGLRLFNIDMIREHGTTNIFYVIDINYFPGKWVMEDNFASFGLCVFMLHNQTV